MINETDIKKSISDEVEYFEKLDPSNYQILYVPTNNFVPTLFEIVDNVSLQYKKVMELYPDLVTELIRQNLYWKFIRSK